jgi:hypothetical protein
MFPILNETECVNLSRGRQAGRGGWPDFIEYSSSLPDAITRQNSEAAHFGPVRKVLGGARCAQAVG